MTEKIITMAGERGGLSKNGDIFNDARQYKEFL
jgi:hypothetical protein